MSDNKDQANGRLSIFVIKSALLLNINLEKFPSGIVILKICFIFLQAISKMQITSKDKARADEKALYAESSEYFEEARNTVIGR